MESEGAITVDVQTLVEVFLNMSLRPTFFTNSFVPVKSIEDNSSAVLGYVMMDCTTIPSSVVLSLYCCCPDLLCHIMSCLSACRLQSTACSST
jgi:hypothetical protein